MKKLFDAANRYLQTSDWLTIAVLKFSLISLGMMLGMAVGRKNRKPVFLTALAVFSATYIPLMARFYRVFRDVAWMERHSLGVSQSREIGAQLALRGVPVPEEAVTYEALKATLLRWLKEGGSL